MFESGPNMRCVTQPSNSPDSSLLDLAFCNSFACAVSKQPKCNVDELCSVAEYSYATWHSMEQLEKLWALKSAVLARIVAWDGGNLFKMSHGVGELNSVRCVRVRLRQLHSPLGEANGSDFAPTRTKTPPIRLCQWRRGLSVQNDRRIVPFALTFQRIRLCPEKKNRPFIPRLKGECLIWCHVGLARNWANHVHVLFGMFEGRMTLVKGRGE